jgi:hypothetical protein
MRILRNWKARRAGGRITISGVDASTGEPVKVAGVDAIEPGEDGPIAIHHEGERFGLAALVDRLAVPLTVGQLVDRLAAIVAADEFARDMRVTFGGDRFPVRGGIAGKNPDNGLVELNLAPVTLDKVGGF